MAYAIVINNTPTEWNGRPWRDSRGIGHPANAPKLYSEAERIAADMYEIIETAIPDGKVSTGSSLVWNAGTVTRTHTLADKPAPSTNPNDYPLNPAQFKALVNYLDKDAAIRAVIAQSPDALQRAWLLSRYENAESYNHGDPFLQSMRAAIGMSEADLSAAWMLAKDLKSGE